jgi:hypothetical protein
LARLDTAQFDNPHLSPYKRHYTDAMNLD